MEDSTPLYWLIPGKLAKAPRPQPADLAGWKAAGIHSVVNLLEEWYADVVQQEKKSGFRVLFSPMPDFGAGSIAQLERTVAWIDAEIGAGRCVVVHCYAGIGRTGTVLIAYLLFKGYAMDEAVREVARVYAGPQSGEQYECLQEYAARLNARQNNTNSQ